MRSYEFEPVSETFSSARYFDRDFFEDELSCVFKAQWLNVGHVCEVPEPGDYVVRDLYGLGVSALIVRDKDTQLRAFYNMCTHRGNKIVMAACNQRGHLRSLTCQFHGWSFNFSGQLVGVPGKDYFGEIDFSDRNLRKMHCAVWGGMIFINLADTPAASLDEHMEPLTTNGLNSYLDGIEWRKAFGWRAVINTNWKLICDAQLEGYHVASLHGRSIGGALPCDHLVPVIYREKSGIPGRLSVYMDLENAKPTPMQAVAAKFGLSGNYVRSKLDSMKTGNPFAFNEESRPDWQFDNYAILPMGVLFVQGSAYMIQRSWPIAPDKTCFEMDVYSPNSNASFGEVFNEAVNEYNLRDVLMEDLATLEHTQANLAYGPVKSVLFSKQEGILTEFHNRIDKMISERKDQGR